MSEVRPKYAHEQTLATSQLRATFGISVVCTKRRDDDFTYAVPETFFSFQTSQSFPVRPVRSRSSAPCRTGELRSWGESLNAPQTSKASLGNLGR